MPHSLQSMTDANIAAAIDDPSTSPDHREALTAEINRRAEVQGDWDLVGEVFEDDSDECHTCAYWFYQYYTDTGAETSCSLLEGDGGSPHSCPAFERVKDAAELMKDETK
jgi:hypothetical protein